MRLRVGTSGYNFPEWKGTFYPAKLPAAKMLGYYGQRLDTVEINYTFYRMPNAKTVAGWAETVPDGFTFVLKMPQRITHIARLKNVDDPLRFFCETVQGLGSKLGPLLLQLPPNFKKDAERLADVLQLLPPGVRCACEFRHESWFADDVYEVLRTANAALCVADTDEATTPLVTTADFGYFRLRDEGYSKEDLETWRDSVRELGKGWQDAYVFFKHEESGKGPAFAEEFRALFG
jgi:uncharacterized protein YecE (DUF72 family)